MVRFLLGLSFLTVLACSQKHGECPSVFFGGEIVNPTSDYVVLYRNDTYIDSVKLNDNNRFSFNLQGIEEGLYHFDHSPELQYVYLQEGDSLLIRLNTMEFDESLVFSGKGSEINNFLVEMFLAYEEEEPLIYSYYKLKPDAFKAKIDSLRTQKIKHLEELIVEDGQLSKKVVSMAMASIDYNSYIYSEKYPFYHKKKTGEETIHELTDNFYDYRKMVDLNSRDLTYFRPYYDYMKYHFGNLSYMACMEDCSNGKMSMASHLHFNKHKLHLVDSLVKDEDLRNLLFRNIAMDYLLKEHNPNKECQIFIDKFRKLSTSASHKEEITHLYEGIQNLQPNRTLPNLWVKDINNESHSLRDISKNEKTVFYFWAGSQKRHFKNITRHINKLKKKHPDLNFVGINVRTSHPQWLSMMEENQLDKSSQFYGEDFKEIQTTMIIDGLNKCVIAKDTLIVDAFANLYYSF
ncbi:TlpA family protein disulfide reductase [Flagellimonas nanhaiensis]|uniref:Transaldolase n=1 Tax=Flagellimonas nanhaiensis TaxID=2292706 RepID=A0A371JU91_9FLAO|nr:transaldolase [Allomuricauda nanhaiensis]RDY61357.1 transaldolase [Allomuricauda nanhaiensis]